MLRTRPLVVWRRVAPPLAALLVTGLLGGCSGAKMAYRYADWLLLQQADTYFCPRDERRAAVKKDAKALVRWHRKAELPRYAQMLDAFADSMDSGFEKEAVMAFRREAQQAWERLVIRAAPRLAHHLETADPGQIKCIDEALAEQRKEALDKLAKPKAERLKDRRKRRAEFLTPWLGELTDAQHAQLSRLMPIDPKTERVATEARYRARLRFRDIVRSRKGVQAALVAFAKDPLHFYSKADRGQAETRTAGEIGRLLKLARVLTAEQRKKLQKTLRGYAADFRAIASGR